MPINDRKVDGIGKAGLTAARFSASDIAEIEMMTNARVTAQPMREPT